MEPEKPVKKKPGRKKGSIVPNVLAYEDKHIKDMNTLELVSYCLYLCRLYELKSFKYEYQLKGLPDDEIRRHITRIREIHA